MADEVEKFTFIENPSFQWFFSTENLMCLYLDEGQICLK